MTSLAQGTWQSGSVRWDKITTGWGGAGPGSSGFAPVAAQQEKCLLSPKRFFLFFWPKSPFATKLLSQVLYADRSRVAHTTDPKIRKPPICTQEIRELVSTFLSVNGSTILHHLYDLPMEKFCLWFKEKCSHFSSVPHKHFHLVLDPTNLKSAVISSKKWHEHRVLFNYHQPSEAVWY